MARIESFTAILNATPVEVREVLRYMGTRDADDELLRVLDECVAEAKGVLSATLCYDEFDISVNGDEIDLGFCKVQSRDLAKNLSGCDRAVVFAATVGLGVDRLISKYKNASPTKALCISAIGSERVEALCDEFCRMIDEKYAFVRPRYSAGYGDLDLGIQKDIFRALGCTKSIGISLGESLLMTPVKSVTAIVGVKKESGK